MFTINPQNQIFYAMNSMRIYQLQNRGSLNQLKSESNEKIVEDDRLLIKNGSKIFLERIRTQDRTL